MAKAEGAAPKKRERISKNRQQIIAVVLVASVILGISIVTSIYLFKYIMAYNKVIGAGDEAKKNYSQTIINIGICKDANKDGDLNARELASCDPNSVKISDVPNSLRANILNNISTNIALESVADEGKADCYNEDGSKKDYQSEYKNAQNDEDRAKAVKMIETCSALRVIPDAIPSQANQEALLSSLNYIFNVSEWEPEGISPDNGSSSSSKKKKAISDVETLGTIPVSFTVEAGNEKTLTVLANMERSIRDFEFEQASISWSENNELELNGSATSFYVDKANVRERTDTITTTSNSQKKSNSSSNKGGSKK